MNDVPTRPAHITSSATGVVITETIDYRIPNGPVMVEQESLRKSDPNRYNDEKSALEVYKVEVLCQANGFRVIAQTPV